VLQETGAADWGNNGRCIDSFNGMQYVYTGTKHGFVGVATMIAKANPADDPPHFWYGLAGQPCCHGYDPGGFAGTGQKASSAIGRFMLFDPAHIAEVHAGTRGVTSTPNTFQNLLDYSGWVGGTNLNSNWQFQNLQYHEPTKLLFLPETERLDAEGGYRPNIHVFEVIAA
jgi:hypothetical protein